MIRLAKSLALLSWLVAGLLSAPARAANLEDGQVIADIVAGRYDRLPLLEARAQRGDPTAMHWWAVLLDACAIDRCRRDEAAHWWRKAALAGNARARRQVFILYGSEATTDDPHAGIGEPRTTEEKLAWAATLLGTQGVDKSLEASALAMLKEVDAATPTMLSMHLTLAWGRADPIPAARAMLAAGTPFEPMVGESLRRQLLLRERKRYPELLAMARQGDAAVATALCVTYGLVEGGDELPPDLYAICEAAFERGQLGIADVLLQHHVKRGDMPAAARYARWCWSLPVSCASSLSEYEERRLGNSQAWRDGDAMLFIAGGGLATDDVPLSARRLGLSTKVRRLEAQQACMRRAYLSEDRSRFADDAACPWGKPPH